MFRFIGKVILNIVVTLATIAGLIFGVGYLINENKDAISAEITKSGEGLREATDAHFAREQARILSGNITEDERAVINSLYR